MPRRSGGGLAKQVAEDVEKSEAHLQIRLQHPAYHATGDDLIEGRQGVMGAELGSAGRGALHLAGPSHHA